MAAMGYEFYLPMLKVPLTSERSTYNKQGKGFHTDKNLFICLFAFLIFPFVQAMVWFLTKSKK